MRSPPVRSAALSAAFKTPTQLNNVTHATRHLSVNAEDRHRLWPVFMEAAWRLLLSMRRYKKTGLLSQGMTAGARGISIYK